MIRLCRRPVLTWIPPRAACVIVLWLCLAGSTFAQVSQVNTIADLVALKPDEQHSNLRVLGYHTPGDGGGGAFAWRGDSESPTNRGLSFRSPLTGTGRWERLGQAPLNPLWFGAIADGVTTNTVALQDMCRAAEARTNAISFPSTTLPFATGNLWLTNGVNLRITGDSAQVRLVYDPASVIDYGAGFGYAIKAAFVVVGATNHNAPGLISGFRFTCASDITNITGQTSGTVCGLSFATSDNWTVSGNVFELPGFQGVGNAGSSNLLVQGNTFKDCGLQSGIGYRNSKIFGGDYLNNFAASQYLARGAWNYTVKDNDFYGRTERKFAFFSAAPDFLCESNRFHLVQCGSTNIFEKRPNTYQDVIVAYVGDIGWADNEGRFQTNYSGVIRGNTIEGTFDRAITVRGNEQRSAIASFPADNQVDVDSLKTRVQVVGNVVRSTATNGHGIWLFTAREAVVQGNDVVVKGSPFVIFGDCSGAVIRGNNPLRSFDQGFSQGATIQFASNASGNTGATDGCLFEDNVVISGPNDQWFLRSAAVYKSTLRNMSFLNNDWYFVGTKKVDAGAPMLFEIREASESLVFRGNTFWISTNLNGRQLIRAGGASESGGSSRFIFENNRVMGVNNLVADVRGVSAHNFDDVAYRGNTLGYLGVESTDHAIITFNRLVASNNLPQIHATNTTNVVITENFVRNARPGSQSAIQVGAGGAFVIEDNQLDVHSSNPPILAQGAGKLFAQTNQITNGGSGGSVAVVKSGATLEGPR